MKSEFDIESMLKLIPDREYFPANNRIMSEADYYGASRLISTELNKRFVPFSNSQWRHGWIHVPVKFKEQLTGWGYGKHYLLATEGHVDFLKQFGVKATAVGMPFVYGNAIDHTLRIPNSLLVMPMHTLPYTPSKGDEERYVQEIAKIRNDFDIVAFCVHHSCYEKGLWPELLEKYKFPMIVGAAADQSNAITRLQKMFSLFEFVTTNNIGSHIPYAAYSGAKVSIWGNFQELSIKDFEKDPFRIAYPHIYEHNFKYCEESYVKRFVPFLFCSHPKDAIQHVEWAKKELGYYNKKTVKEMAKLLGWNNPFAQIKGLSQNIRRSLVKVCQNM